MTTVGSVVRRVMRRSTSARRRAMPSVATTSTGRGRSADGGAVEEAAVVGQADVGQQVAVAGGLGGQHAGEVLADHQPGDAGVAAEELVAHRQHAHVVATESSTSGPSTRAP